MAEDVTVTIGNLYAGRHEQFKEELGEQYEERLRKNVEEFVHNFNQQVERQQEQAFSGEEELAQEMAEAGSDE
jgi:hypothetical protein